MPRILPAAAAMFALSLGACGETEPEPILDEVVAPEPTPTGPDATELATSFPRDRVTLDGTVISTTPSQLLLDYGSGEITVEVDDWDSFGEATLINPGDRVIVTGLVDGSFLTSRSIEARSVFVEDLNTTFFAAGADEEDFGLSRLGTAAGATNVNFTGRVREIDGRAFVMGTDNARFTVDTSRMSYDPLDEEGYQRIEAGERVFVWGEFGPASGDTARLIADGIVSLTPDAPEEESVAFGPEDSAMEQNVGSGDARIGNASGP
ncbi:hypothetical protein [Sphingosinithalassobacter sp. CS137]|uniref:hypothetical protein n=1 Tax=Sphingosinithalassobacter sp. CS137 TaxID=2762748 RepID=UPI00165DC011|nr:hypothetical protein [Sphingosinithalassobacter sp. CS137]